MNRFLALFSLFVLSVPTVVLAGSSCVAFDITWNLLAFGFDGKDYNAGTQDTWASGTASEITTSGRPPFNGANVTCYLSQFTNAIYVLGADSASPATIHIYDATAQSWSTQSVTPGNFDPTSFNAILDHDTNVFYALSKGEFYSLDMGLLKTANSTAVVWNDVQKANFDASQPVMALAQNHIHFLDVPDVPAGNAMIFVIHFSFQQPQPQAYGDFPNTHGQTASFFMDQGVQQEFAYIPDDGSATYVINVESNTTQTLKGPIVKDPSAFYFASTDALVQLSSSGAVSYLPYKAGSASVNSAATWSTVSKLPSAASTASPSGSPSSTATNSANGPIVSDSGAAAAGNDTNTGKGSSTPSSGAVPQNVGLGLGAAMVLTIAAFIIA